AAKSVALAPFFAMHEYAFEINCLRCIRHDVGLEDWRAILRPNPHPALLDSPRSSFHESLRVASEWVSAGLLGSHLSVDLEHMIQIFQRSLAQARNILAQQKRRSLFKHEFLADSSRF